MRLLVFLCLAAGLWAGDPPLPGRDVGFLASIVGDTEGGARPWRALKTPVESASAVVEVVGEFTAEDLRQIAFNEFLVWFQEDLRRFWRRQGVAGPPENLAAGALPIDRAGGNPVPKNVPLVGVHF